MSVLKPRVDSCLSAEFRLDENLAVARLGHRGTNSGLRKNPDMFGVLRCQGSESWEDASDYRSAGVRRGSAISGLA